MNHSMANDWSATKRDQKNQHRIVVWALLWVVPFLGANIAIKQDWIQSDALALAATVVVTGLGLGLLLAYRRFLAGADELMQKIQLDALALTVGVGVVAGFSYTLLETASVVGDADVMTLIVIMAVTYIVGVIAGLRRFA